MKLRSWHFFSNIEAKRIVLIPKILKIEARILTIEARILKIEDPEIDSEEPIPLPYVAWLIGLLFTACQAEN
jgi:hypothetical protein